MSDTYRQRYLAAMGIETWQLRAGCQTGNADVAPPVLADRQARTALADEPIERVGGAVAGLDWEGLAAAVRECRLCGLCTGRTQAVFGTGNRAASWLFIGEAPGKDEDEQGEPFVGPAGQLLNAMLAAVGLVREQVYIANVIKCRPPGNRDPQPDEVSCCQPYLQRQIELVKPSIIVLLGRVAAHAVLACDQALGALRGHVYRYGDQEIPMVVTYHPAYLLRTPADKRKAWDDLCLARRTVGASAV